MIGSRGVSAVPNFTYAISLARGAIGAELDLAYLDVGNHLQHTRLTDEAGWTWSTPVAVDASTTYSAVWIAAGP